MPSTFYDLFVGLKHASSIPSSSDIPRRTLGHAGEKVSMVGVGGYHLGGPHLWHRVSIPAK